MSPPLLLIGLGIGQVHTWQVHQQLEWDVVRREGGVEGQVHGRRVQVRAQLLVHAELVELGPGREEKRRMKQP